MSFLVQTAAAPGGRRYRGHPESGGAVHRSTVLSWRPGWAKLPGHAWRTGDALVKIMRTQTYGDEWFYRQLDRLPMVSRAICHGVLALECGFPLLLLRKGKFIDLGLFSMGAFHLANARFMGLSRFAWAFIATYPSVRALARGTGGEG